MDTGQISISVARATSSLHVGPICSFPRSPAPLKDTLSIESYSCKATSPPLSHRTGSSEFAEGVCRRWGKGSHHVAKLPSKHLSSFLAVPGPVLKGLLFPNICCPVSSHAHLHLLLHSLPGVPSGYDPGLANPKVLASRLELSPQEALPSSYCILDMSPSTSLGGVGFGRGDATAQ